MTTTIPNQVITKTRIIGNERLIVSIRHDDHYRNGHNTFRITGTLYERHNHSGDWYETACGMLHDEIRRFFPELAPYLKWHLCTTDGPMHYLANTLYHANDKDHNGLRKGESRQIRDGKTGTPSWKLMAFPTDGSAPIPLHELPDYLDADEPPPCPYTLVYAPWCRIGEGKLPDLEAARVSAIWPDATLEQLQNEQALKDRLPALVAEFQTAVESLWLIY